MVDQAHALPPPVERSFYPVVRMLAALGMMTMGGAAMYAAIVALKPVAAEFGVSRGMGSLPYLLFMLGFGFGGVVFGRIADRIGIFVPALLASVALASGFWLAARADAFWQYCVAVGVLSGLIGASITFSPLIADISHWFTRRRGLAISIVISGSYVAGTVWPRFMQYVIDTEGWRAMYDTFAGLVLLVMLPLCLLMRRRPDADAMHLHEATRARLAPLTIPPAALQTMICVAGIGCCAAMAMPQVHIVAYASDLGFAAVRGTEMLSLMLGAGIISRLASGWLSDRIGGLRTLLLGSTFQGLALVGYLFADSLHSLYWLSVLFGLSQGGIVPSYALIVRRFFPAAEAGWRIGMALLFTVFGMALGGWMAGVLFDLSGNYQLSFINALAFNALNLIIAVYLLKKLAV